jgi:hypothetical protein
MRWRLHISAAVVLVGVLAGAALLSVNAEQSDGNDGSSTATQISLDPGEQAIVDCETDLSLVADGDGWLLECAALPEPEPTSEPEPEPEPDPAGPLLADYSFTAGAAERFVYLEEGFVAGLEQDSPYGTRTVTDAGPYAGWDVLLVDQGDDPQGGVRTLSTNDWITLQLSQPATVAIVWQADEPVPAWLADWESQGEPVVVQDSLSARPRQVLERTFEAGDVVLGGVYAEGESGGQRSPYYVVLQASEAQPPSEDDDGSSDEGGQDDGSHDDDAGHDDGHGHEPGDPGEIDDVHEWLFGTHHWSVEPLSVVDTSQLEQPVEGQACPDWVTRRHVTQGPDGMYYLTWRDMIDDEYGCHFTYEHGSNPERVPGAQMPAFAYGTPEHMKESDYGFKVKALHAEDNIQVLATTHFGTAEPHLAACQQFHWNNFQFVQGGELVADIYVMGDFGAARKNDTNEPLERQCVHQRTGELTDQHQLTQESAGVRLNPVCTGPSTSDCGPFYYPWRMSTPGVSEVLGFHSQAYTVNTPTVVAACEDMRCESSRHIGGTGAWAFVSFRTGFGVRDPGHSADGVFYTNPYGDELRSADDPDAMRQYIKPGTDIRLVDLSDQTSYFPDSRHGGTHGDYTLTQLENGDPNIAHNHRAAVDPQGYIGDRN